MEYVILYSRNYDYLLMYGNVKAVTVKERAVVFLLLTGIATICMSQISFAYAATSSTNYAGSVLSSPWTGEAAAIGPDNNKCATSNAGEVGYWQNFGINIPNKSTVTGIEVLVDSSQPKSDNNLIVQVGKTSKILGATEKQVMPTTGSCASSTVQKAGGPAELWGLSWTTKEINSQTFGVQIKGGMEGSQVQLDSVAIIVHYVSDTTEESLEVYTGDGNLLATPLSQSIINLSWSPPSDGSKIKNYIIERKSPGDDSYVVIDSIPSKFLAYSDAGLLGNTEYHYRISATKSDGTLSSPNEVAVTTIPFENKKSTNDDGTGPLTRSIDIFSNQNGTATLGFSKKLKGYTVIPTQMMQTGVERQIQIIVSDNSGIAAIRHVGVLLPFDDDDVIRKSDTFFVYDEGKGLTVSDPLGIFSDVQVYRTYTKTEMILTFTFTPQKPISATDLVINSWDDKLNSQSALIPNAFEIQGEPVGPIINALSVPVPYENPEPKYVFDKDGNMIPYDSFGNLDNKVLRPLPKPFVYDENIGKLERNDDGFYDLVISERIKAKEIFDTLVIDPIHPEDQKIFKVKKIFKYPVDVGKTDRTNVKKMKVALEQEIIKAQNTTMNIFSKNHR